MACSAAVFTPRSVLSFVPYHRIGHLITTAGFQNYFARNVKKEVAADYMRRKRNQVAQFLRFLGDLIHRL
jgi:hypothetical protein